MNNAPKTANTVEIRLPKPHQGQRLVIESKARYKVLMCGRRWGKTLVSMVIAIQGMLKGKRIAYVTPEFGLGKDFFKEILTYIPDALIRINNKSELYIELITGGSLKFFSGEALDSFRGRKFHTVIIDEAAFISDLENAWTNSVRPTLTDFKGNAIFISTPRGKNFFYSLYLKGLNKEPDYESWQFTSYENPYIDNSEIDSAKQSLPDLAFRQEYLAEPSANAANPFDNNAIRRNTIITLSTKPPVVFGIDIARVQDWTVICGLDEDGVMCYFKRFQKSFELTAREIQEVNRLYPNIPKVVDNSGIGAVVVERLIYEFNINNVIPFNFTSESKPKIIYELIKDIEKDAVKFNEVTANELNVFEYKTTSTGHIKFEAQSGFHDDTVMALALANHKKKEYQLITNWRLY